MTLTPCVLVFILVACIHFKGCPYDRWYVSEGLFALASMTLFLSLAEIQGPAGPVQTCAVGWVFLRGGDGGRNPVGLDFVQCKCCWVH